METTYIKNPARLVNMIYRFLAYIHFRDGEDNPISFVDNNTFLGREENYKSKAAEKAGIELDYSKWNRKWINNGEIRQRAVRAMSKAGNLVNVNQQTMFKDQLNSAHKRYQPDAVRILYDIYKSEGVDEESKAFTEALSVFGRKYDTVAYLFFIKDSSRFLPVSPGNFEKSLASVGIEYHLSGRCSWENYNGFIEIVKEVQTVMQEVLTDTDVRLIDAHSFLWVINEYDPTNKEIRFLNWDPDKDVTAEIENDTEAFLQDSANGKTVRKMRLSQYISRSAEVVRITKERAKGVCQLCGQPAPFIDKNGNPYLEAHHIVWLSRGGEDNTDNTVALCPNCHTKMHIVDDDKDVEFLKKQSKKGFTKM